jgi:hypothetical protein
MIELTHEQHAALERGESLVRDAATNETYVLVRLEVYERLKALLAPDEYDPDEGLAYINEVMAEDDAGDPLLEKYQDYRKGAP